MRDVVRPFRARVVRQEAAAQNVSQMLDAQPTSERSLPADPSRPSRVIDPDAYADSEPALYVYLLRRGEEEHVGVVGDVSARAFVDGQVRGHEAVQPDRVEALVAHFASAAARSELVALLHRSGPEVDTAVADSMRSEPMIRFTGPDEWEQTVWRIPESASRVLTEALSHGVHYIADGHHRVAASLSEWHRSGLSTDAGLICVIFPIDGLRLLAFHRRVTGPIDLDDLLPVLSEAFVLSDIAHPDEATGCFGLYLHGRWYDAAHTGSRAPGAAGLDISILNERVLEPLLHRGAPSARRLEIASALSPLVDLTRACDRDGGVLFVLRPPTLEQLTEVSDRGEVMPPKTTYFDPKPYAGIFLH